VSRLFFSADNHFGHDNIRLPDYANRPFKSLEHMNGEMIRRWNERVKPDDTIVVVGDFMFRNSAGGKKGEGDTKKAEYYKGLLNGEKVFINGSHDRNNGVKTRIRSLIIEFNNEEIYVRHDPNYHRFTHRLNLCGHVHNLWKHKEYETGKWLINVGVDVWNFYPVVIDEIYEYYKKLKSGKII
jgi:calcineurin-like phosphoesterase family protein